ncbi:hypothetical protein K227x_29080 [Rubripirellula lacrimiformis]|uniref:Uncharacterized protein n=1 Tax=Rubripirellula lacrimiformis TaxID=1930273 RepID=A0A517NBJ4_9BACT|nr:hypothetical protein K227x_29080 [Rubripirellula lacrimiformis]
MRNNQQVRSLLGSLDQDQFAATLGLSPSVPTKGGEDGSDCWRTIRSWSNTTLIVRLDSQIRTNCCDASHCDRHDQWSHAAPAVAARRKRHAETTTQNRSNPSTVRTYSVRFARNQLTSNASTAREQSVTHREPSFTGCCRSREIRRRDTSVLTGPSAARLRKSIRLR